eukprot:SAG22_NODE_76_length_22248_cov_14.352070_8_plen_326_part_00
MPSGWKKNADGAGRKERRGGSSKKSKRCAEPRPGGNQGKTKQNRHTHDWTAAAAATARSARDGYNHTARTRNDRGGGGGGGKPTVVDTVRQLAAERQQRVAAEATATRLEQKLADDAIELAATEAMAAELAVAARTPGPAAVEAEEASPQPEAEFSEPRPAEAAAPDTELSAFNLEADPWAGWEPGDPLPTRHNTARQPKAGPRQGRGGRRRRDCYWKRHNNRHPTCEWQKDGALRLVPGVDVHGRPRAGWEERRVSVQAEWLRFGRLGEATVLSFKGSDHCLSLRFSAFPCGSTALTADRCNQRRDCAPRRPSTNLTTTWRPST